MKAAILEGIGYSEENGNTLGYRLKTPNASVYRGLSIQVREQMAKEWKER